MKRTLIAALALSSAVAHAEAYRCPSNYPGKDAPAAALTNAYVMWGERPSSGPPFPAGWVTPIEEVAEEGMNRHYGVPDDEPVWLICEYGARKRVKGRFHNGHEWGQHMEQLGEQPWFIRVAPRVTDCTVQTREIKRDRGNSTWTVTADCKRAKP